MRSIGLRLFSVFLYKHSIDFKEASGLKMPDYRAYPI